MLAWQPCHTRIPLLPCQWHQRRAPHRAALHSARPTLTPCSRSWGSSRGQFGCMDPGHPQGRPKGSAWFLAPAWYLPSHCSHLQGGWKIPLPLGLSVVTPSWAQGPHGSQPSFLPAVVQACAFCSGYWRPACQSGSNGACPCQGPCLQHGHHCGASGHTSLSWGCSLLAGAVDRHPLLGICVLVRCPTRE